MASSYCQICINRYPLPEFLFFRCGHGFCISCIGSLFRERYKISCPNCRVLVTRQDARAIFIDVVEPKVSAATAVVEGLNEMGGNSKLVIVRKAEEKFGKTAGSLKVDEDTAAMLLHAVSDFKERIIPVFTKVEAQMEEIISLRRDLHAAWHEKEQLEARYQEVRKVETDVQEMKESVFQALNERDKAITLAEQACSETVKLREAKELITHTISTLEGENERYQNQLHIHMKLERTRKDKISRLKQEILVLKEATHLKENGGALRPPVQAHIEYLSTQEILMPVKSTDTQTPGSIIVCGTKGKSTRHDFEGMPSPRFASEWQIEAPQSKKRKSAAIANEGMKNEFPIGLNKGGYPLKTVQLGPKKLLRAPPA
ncbi:hypothetical protein BDZ94DRAFT_1268414 [Collybia nuda]|uniref:RING-type domain-containing protein n=1 Tax=Collybia nuda TaxID=64659 RepID=A0A9P6CEN2_9AGAR|nr:hypothetical protein BDZ94DRAFT_1268414 [Collybia nuda]